MNACDAGIPKCKRPVSLGLLERNLPTQRSDSNIRFVVNDSSTQTALGFLISLSSDVSIRGWSARTPDLYIPERMFTL
jgi:hypothetical protein